MKFFRSRLVVLSYHSLEDRRVKKLFRSGSVYGEEVDSAASGSSSSSSSSNSNPWIELSRRALPPTDEEIAVNRRSRSAKLRVATRAQLPTDTVAADDSESADSLSGRMKRKKQKISTPFIGAKQRAKMIAADKDEE